MFPNKLQTLRENIDTQPDETKEEDDFAEKVQKKQKSVKETSRKGKTHSIIYDSEESVRAALVEISVYACFLVLTIIVATASRSMYLYYFNKGVENVFIDTSVSFIKNVTTVNYHEMATTKEFFDFLELRFLPQLHDTAAVRADGHLIFMGQNILLGPPRLRQLRVKEDSCDVSEIFGSYFNNCYAAYERSLEEKEEIYQNLKYRTLSELEVFPIWGEIKTYYGGGYVKDLTFDRQQNMEIVKELREQLWLDRGTRLVVVEFNMYNVNLALFNSVKFIIETPPIGGVVPSAAVQTVSYSSIFYGESYWLVAFAVCFYLFAMFYAIQEWQELRNFGVKNYFSAMWNYVDLTIILLAILSLSYNIWHPLYMFAIMERIRDGADKFLSLDMLCFWNMMYEDMMAVCAFLVCIKVFKFISFNKSMLQFSTTLKRCSHDLLGFGVMFGIVFFAYAQLGLLLFGSVDYDFRNFLESLLTMMRMILGDLNYEALERANRVLGPVYFLTYIFLVFFILLNMFLAVINDTYSTVKSEIQTGHNYLPNYIWNLCDKFCAKFCKRKHDDTEKTEPDHQSVKDAKSFAPVKLPVDKEESRKLFNEMPNSDERAQIIRLTARVAAMEDVLEELIADMDSAIRRIAPRRKGGFIERHL